MDLASELGAHAREVELAHVVAQPVRNARTPAEVVREQAHAQRRTEHHRAHDDEGVHTEGEDQELDALVRARGTHVSWARGIRAPRALIRLAARLRVRRVVPAEAHVHDRH